ncbi:MAG TPA: MOSC domain-containing protein [Tepidisphaeraceae bacterium]|jgi:MOSC domain-containing protein YiiM
MSEPVLLSIQVGMPRANGVAGAADPMDQPWFSGFYKAPVAGPVRVGRLNLAGDGQADLSAHGGPDRPILAYCAEHYDRWREERVIDDAPFGSFGENFTVSGHHESEVCIGDQYAVGPVRLEVSQPRQPCWKLARRWRNKGIPALVIRHDRGGWYLRVLEQGTVEAGMGVQLLDRPFPQWTIARANHLLRHGMEDPQTCRALAACPAISADWRQYLNKRADAK